MPNGTETLYPIKQFNFKHTDAETNINYVWRYMYEAIANDNLLLGYIDDHKDMRHYALLKGEALGLRAYMHIDLLRLFGPQTTNGSAKAIPYRTEYNNKLVHIMTVDEVMQAAEKDLLEAYDLLKDDPIKTVGRRNIDLTNYDAGIAEDFRGSRMNYYAVCGTLARLYMLMGQKQKAAQYAQEVIDAKDIFWLITPADRNQNSLYQNEMVFGLYLGQNITNTLGRITGTGGSQAEVTISDGLLQKVFVTEGEGASDDYRYGTTMWASAQGQEGKTTRKYFWDTNTTANTSTLYQPMAPMLRLTEMYYIVAEANAATPSNGVTVNMLNAVRKSRNVPNLTKENYTEPQLMELILAEARRDLIAEGQIFYWYKRLNHAILTENGEIEPAQVKWQWPLPTSEQQYNN